MEATMSPRRTFARSCKRSTTEINTEKIPKKRQKRSESKKSAKIAIKKLKMPDLSRISDEDEDQLSALFRNQTNTNINVCHDDLPHKLSIKKEPTVNDRQNSNFISTPKRRGRRNIKKEIPTADNVAKECNSNDTVAKNEVEEKEGDSVFIELVNEINQETVAAIR